MRNAKWFWWIGLLLIGFIACQQVVKKTNVNPVHAVGDALDSLNGVVVYYNGGVGHVEERNTVDGYNVGLKYQCVEFVKRYYFEFYKHRMPDSYGHAKSFFQENREDGAKNTQRDLTQYTNPSKSKPQVGDLVVFDGTVWNEYGHVAIISAVTEKEIEIIQQNPGPFAPSREKFTLENNGTTWTILDDQLLGWLRKR